MADPADIGNDNVARNDQAALEKHRLAMAQRPGKSASHCEECGEPIPGDRRRAVRGCTRCCPCQTAFEKVNR